jgi:nucleotide-binding universal stress UspA family protein
MRRGFRKILVPYDFSPSADAALAVAIDLGEKHGGDLMVMHAIPPIVPLHGSPIQPPAIEIAREAGQLARAVAAAMKRRRRRRVRTWIMVGSPAGCIVRAARDADAIVMGTLGRTGLPHVLLGSVAERVVRHASVPVLTVRASRGKRKATTTFRRMLVPYDFSVHAGAALRTAVDLAVVHRGRVTVLHVVSAPSSLGETARERNRLRRDVHEKLRTAIQSLVRGRRVTVRSDVVIGDPVAAILAAAPSADSIVMSTLGQTGIARWLVGSVAEKVVRLSPVPVLTVRAARPKTRVRRAVRAIR